MDVTNKMVEQLAGSLRGAISTNPGGLTSSQILYALDNTSGFRARFGEAANSQIGQMLGDLSDGAGKIAPEALEEALTQTRVPPRMANSAMETLADTGVLNSSLIRNKLAGKGLSSGATSRVLKAITTGGGKKALAVLGAAAGVAGKLGGAPLDLIIGSDAGSPGGLSNGEIVGTKYNEPYDFLGEIDDMEERNDMMSEGIRGSRLNRNDNGDIEATRGSEMEIAKDALSPTSGNGTIMSSLINLIGR